MSRSSRLRVLGAGVSLVSLGAVVWWAVHQPAPTWPTSRHDVAALVGAVLVYAVGLGLRAERWRLLLRRNGAEASRAETQSLNLVGYMGNNVLPARGGDVLRVALLSPRAEAGTRTVIGTLVAERVLDVATLGLLFVVLAYGVLRGIDTPGTGALAIVLAVVAGLGALALAALALGRHRPWVARLRTLLTPLAAATLRLRGRHGALMAALTLVIWFLEAVTWYLVGHATALDPSPIQALYLVAVASVFVLIPSGPGYAGTLDAAIVFGVRAIGAAGAVAVSYLVLLRFVLLAPVTIAGLVVLLVRHGGLARLRRARVEAPGT